MHGPLATVARLLGCDADTVANSLASSLVMVRGETIVLNNTMGTARDSRDAMAKALYERLFAWIVNRANALLDHRGEQVPQATTIGVLDIFGFESLAVNSLEQLCM
jgi:myosin heavy subunit